MKIGYIRVSTVEQNTARQEILMDELGVERMYIDKLSGKNTNRPELMNMLDFVREGDIVIVSEFSRLARSTKDLLKLVDELSAKGVQLISKKEQLDTSTPQGKFMLTIFGAIAELERATILERQKEGIAIAKSDGKYTGRKPIKLDEDRQEQFNEMYADVLRGKYTNNYVMQEMGFKRNTYYKFVAKYREEHKNNADR